MEYLMTYGWAILIVIIVAAVLFALGVFNPATYTQTTAVGFSGFNVPPGSFQLKTDGVLTMQVTNGVGANINITEAKVTVGVEESINTTVDGILLGPGQTATIIFPPLEQFTTGAAYSASVIITFTNRDTGLVGFTSSGTLTGTVS